MIIWKAKCSWVEFRDQMHELFISSLQMGSRKETWVVGHDRNLIYILKHLIGPITWLYKTFCKNHNMIKIRKSIVNCPHTKILVNFVNELGNLTWSNLSAMFLAHKLASILKIQSQICESSLDSWMYLMKVSLNVWFRKLKCERKNI